MEQLGTVQQKISCVFETRVLEEQSAKRNFQPYRVIASEIVKAAALDSDVYHAIATEKLDGTCVYIAEHKGSPWLWARLDRKPNKASDKRFKKYQNQQQAWRKAGQPEPEPTFQWNVEKDFKDVPEYWIPALGVPIIDNQPQPDDNGHIPGWVPVEKKLRQYCWHVSAVDLSEGLGLFLMQSDRDEDDLQIKCLPLSDVVGRTAELIGTNVNGNAYGIGNKKVPLHFLVVHGSIPVSIPPQLTLSDVRDWFLTTDTGQVEGIVYHCQNGKLFKIHRHHLGLPWPLKDTATSLSKRRVQISVQVENYDSLDDRNPTISFFINHFRKLCDSITDLSLLYESENNSQDA